MARICKISALLILIVVFSCEKGDHVSCVQRDFYAYLDNYPVNSICIDSLCLSYQAIWKELFMTKNNITENYFKDHIEICRSQVHDWVDGASYNVCYKIKIDWAIAYNCDQFIIKIEKNNKDYPSLILPRGTYLSKEDIRIVTSGRAFSSDLSMLSNSEAMDYNSFNEAMDYLKKMSGVNALCSTMIYIDKSTGNLLLKAHAQYDNKENECISGLLDLINGTTTIEKVPCYIN